MVIVTGTITVLFLVPLLIANIMLSKFESARQWFEEWRPADPLSPWGSFVLTLCTLAVPFGTLSAAWLSLEQIAVLATRVSGGMEEDPSGFLAVVLVVLGPVAYVVVLLAVARRWRLPREIAVVGSALAVTGHVLLESPLWWAAVLAAVPSMLLWLPASAPAFGPGPAPSATSEVAPRRVG
jgi:hypothetical protein